MEIVRLTTTELMVAGYIGTARNVQSSVVVGRDPGVGLRQDDNWTKNIEGAAGEMAVAKLLGIYWMPRIGDIQADDVGPYQVRTNASRRLDDMALHDKDRDDRAFISVLSFVPDFHILGWIMAKDGKQASWSRVGTPGRPPCYFVPRSALHPMSDLPPPVAANDNTPANGDTPHVEK